MQRLIGLCVGIGIFLFVGGVTQAAEIPESVKELVRHRVDDGRTVGMVIGLVDEEGVDYYAYGSTRGGEGITPDEHSIFEIGSITKVFTGILLAEMCERGEVSLDDPIEKFLPDTVTAPTRNGASITLAHLSEQTSGLPRMPSNFRPQDPTNPFADYTAERLYEYLSGYTLTRDIGAKQAYSNTGVGLLGHLLERAAGRSYEALVVARIANPLDMANTRITLTEDMKSRLAYGHANGEPVSNWDLDVLAGAGAIRSSAADMVAFLRANIGLRETPLRTAMLETHRPRVAAEGDMLIGLGWFIRMADEGTPVFWHNGGTGGYRTFAGFSARTRTGAVVLTNSTGRGDDDIGFHLLNPAFPLVNAVIRKEIEVDPSILETYVGKYRLNDDRVMRISLRGGSLTAQLDRQPALPIYSESETDFFFKDVDAQIRFERDADGKVSGLSVHQDGEQRTGERIED